MCWLAERREEEDERDQARDGAKTMSALVRHFVSSSGEFEHSGSVRGPWSGGGVPRVVRVPMPCVSKPLLKSEVVILPETLSRIYSGSAGADAVRVDRVMYGRQRIAVAGLRLWSGPGSPASRYWPCALPWRPAGAHSCSPFGVPLTAVGGSVHSRRSYARSLPARRCRRAAACSPAGTSAVWRSGSAAAP